MRKRKTFAGSAGLALAGALGIALALAPLTHRDKLGGKTGSDTIPSVAQSLQTETVPAVSGNNSVSPLPLKHGGVVVRAHGEPVKLQAEGTTITTSQGEIVVFSQAGEVSVLVREGAAEVVSSSAHDGQKVLLAAGEGLEEGPAPSDEDILEELGQHEDADELKLRHMGMHEVGELGEVAFAELGVISALGLHEVAAASILPFLGSTAGLGTTAFLLSRGTDSDSAQAPISF